MHYASQEAILSDAPRMSKGGQSVGPELTAAGGKSFRVPKLRREESKDNLRAVEVTSRDALEVVATIRRSYLESNYTSRWQLQSVQFVENRDLEEKYRQKKLDMKEEGRNARDLTEQYAYVIPKDTTTIPMIVKGGLKCHRLQFNALGDSKLGVYLGRNADVQLRMTEGWPTNNIALIVYKVTLGKCKVIVGGQSGDGLIEPTPNYDCHVPQTQPKPSDHIFLQHARSQVYLYEYTDECIPAEHPRHVLPYAVLLYDKIEKPTVPLKQTTDSYSKRPTLPVEKPRQDPDAVKAETDNTPSIIDPTNVRDSRSSGAETKLTTETGLCVPRLTAGPPPGSTSMDSGYQPSFGPADEYDDTEMEPPFLEPYVDEEEPHSPSPPRLTLLPKKEPRISLPEIELPEEDPRLLDTRFTRQDPQFDPIVEQRQDQRSDPRRRDPRSLRMEYPNENVPAKQQVRSGSQEDGTGKTKKKLSLKDYKRKVAGGMSSTKEASDDIPIRPTTQAGSSSIYDSMRGNQYSTQQSNIFYHQTDPRQSKASAPSRERPLPTDPRQYPIDSRQPPLDQRNYQTDPRQTQTDPRKTHTDPRQHQMDPRQHQTDPRQHQTDPRQHQTDPRQYQMDPMQTQTDPRQHQMDPRHHQTDPRQTQMDPRQHQTDPRQHQMDPRQTQTDPRQHQMDPRQHQTDPRQSLNDPRQPQIDPRHTQTDPRKSQSDPRQPSMDPRKTQTDLRQPRTDPRQPRTDPRLVKQEKQIPTLPSVQEQLANQAKASTSTSQQLNQPEVLQHQQDPRYLPPQMVAPPGLLTTPGIISAPSMVLPPTMVPPPNVGQPPPMVQPPAMVPAPRMVQPPAQFSQPPPHLYGQTLTRPPSEQLSATYSHRPSFNRNLTEVPMTSDYPNPYLTQVVPPQPVPTPVPELTPRQQPTTTIDLTTLPRQETIDLTTVPGKEVVGESDDMLKSLNDLPDPDDTSQSPNATSGEDPALAEAMKKLVEFSGNVELFTEALKIVQESAEELGDSLTNPEFLVKKIAEQIELLSQKKSDQNEIKSPDINETDNLNSETNTAKQAVPTIPLESEEEPMDVDLRIRVPPKNQEPKKVPSQLDAAMQKTLAELEMAEKSQIKPKPQNISLSNIPIPRTEPKSDKIKKSLKVDINSIPLPSSTKESKKVDNKQPIKSHSDSSITSNEKGKSAVSFSICRKSSQSPETIPKLADAFKSDIVKKEERKAYLDKLAAKHPKHESNKRVEIKLEKTVEPEKTDKSKQDNTSVVKLERGIGIKTEINPEKFKPTDTHKVISVEEKKNVKVGNLDIDLRKAQIQKMDKDLRKESKVVQVEKIQNVNVKLYNDLDIIKGTSGFSKAKKTSSQSEKDVDLRKKETEKDDRNHKHVDKDFRKKDKNPEIPAYVPTKINKDNKSGKFISSFSSSDTNKFDSENIGSLFKDKDERIAFKLHEGKTRSSERHSVEDKDIRSSSSMLDRDERQSHSRSISPPTLNYAFLDKDDRAKLASDITDPFGFHMEDRDDRIKSRSGSPSFNIKTNQNLSKALDGKEQSKTDILNIKTESQDSSSSGSLFDAYSIGQDKKKTSATETKDKKVLVPVENEFGDVDWRLAAAAEMGDVDLRASQSTSSQQDGASDVDTMGSASTSSVASVKPEEKASSQSVFELTPGIKSLLFGQGGMSQFATPAVVTSSVDSYSTNQGSYDAYSTSKEPVASYNTSASYAGEYTTSSLHDNRNPGNDPYNYSSSNNSYTESYNTSMNDSPQHQSHHNPNFSPNKNFNPNQNFNPNSNFNTSQGFNPRPNFNPHMNNPHMMDRPSHMGDRRTDNQRDNNPAAGGPGGMNNIIENMDVSNLKNILSIIHKPNHYPTLGSPSTPSKDSSQIAGPEDDGEEENKPAFCTGLSFLKSKPKTDLARAKYTGFAQLPKALVPFVPGAFDQNDRNPEDRKPNIQGLGAVGAMLGLDNKNPTGFVGNKRKDGFQEKDTKRNIIPGFTESPMSPPINTSKQPFKFSEDIPERNIHSFWSDLESAYEIKKETDKDIPGLKSIKTEPNDNKTKSDSDLTPTKKKSKQSPSSTPNTWQNAILESMEQSALKLRSEDSFISDMDETPIKDSKHTKDLFDAKIKVKKEKTDDHRPSVKRVLDDAGSSDKGNKMAKTSHPPEPEDSDDEESALVIDLASPMVVIKKEPSTDSYKEQKSTASQEPDKEGDVDEDDLTIDLTEEDNRLTPVMDEYKEDSGTDLEDEGEDSKEDGPSQEAIPPKTNDLKSFIEKSRKNMVIRLKGETKIVNPKTGKAYNKAPVGSAIQVLGQPASKQVSKPQTIATVGRSTSGPKPPAQQIHPIHGIMSIGGAPKSGQPIKSQYRPPSPIRQISAISSIVSGATGVRSTSPVNQISTVGQDKYNQTAKTYTHPYTGQQLVYASHDTKPPAVIGQPANRFSGLPGSPLPHFSGATPTSVRSPFIPGQTGGVVRPMGQTGGVVRPMGQTGGVVRPMGQTGGVVRPMGQTGGVVRPMAGQHMARQGNAISVVGQQQQQSISVLGQPIFQQQPKIQTSGSNTAGSLKSPDIHRDPYKQNSKTDKPASSDPFDWFSDQFKKRAPERAPTTSGNSNIVTIKTEKNWEQSSNSANKVIKTDSAFDFQNVKVKTEPNYETSGHCANKVIKTEPDWDLKPRKDAGKDAERSNSDNNKRANESDNSGASESKKIRKEQNRPDEKIAKVLDVHSIETLSKVKDVISTTLANLNESTSSTIDTQANTSGDLELEEGELSDEDITDTTPPSSQAKTGNENLRRVVISDRRSSYYDRPRKHSKDRSNQFDDNKHYDNRQYNYQESPKRIVNLRSNHPGPSGAREYDQPSGRPNKIAADWADMLENPNNRVVERIKATRIETESLINPSSSDDASSLLSKSAASITKAKQKFVATSQVKTLGDWLKVELETDNILPLQNIIPYALNTDLTIIPKARRRKIRAKVKNAIEQENEKKIKNQGQMPPYPEPTPAAVLTPKTVIKPNYLPEVDHDQIEKELQLINDTVSTLKGGILYEPQPGMDPGSAKEMHLLLALATIESEMKTLIHRTCFFGYPHRRVPNELLLDSEKTTFRSELEDVFLILMMPISTKPYKKLIQMKDDLESKYFCLKNQNLLSESMKTQIEGEVKGMHIQRQGLLRSFTGYLNKKRILKIQEQTDKYTMAYNYYRSQKPPVSDTMLKFIRTTQMDLRQHLILAKQYLAIEEKKLEV